MNQDKSNLLDTAAFKPLDAQAAEVQQEAHNAGGATSPTVGALAASGEISAGALAAAIGASSNRENNSLAPDIASDAGVANQTILPGEIGAAGSSSFGDISGSDADVTGESQR